MILPTRTDPSVIGKWWWTVDRWMLLALLTLSVIGILMVVAASPAVAERLGLESFHFVRRQLLYFMPALTVMIGVSLLTPLAIRRVAVVGLLIAILGLLATLLMGHEVNGASRWVKLGALVIQPSEFVKPTLAVATAWMLAERQKNEDFPGLHHRSGPLGACPGIAHRATRFRDGGCRRRRVFRPTIYGWNADDLGRRSDRRRSWRGIAGLRSSAPCGQPHRSLFGSGQRRFLSGR